MGGKARTGTNDARPAFQRMIADSSSGAFQYIIVYMFDRFARNRRDSIMYKELLKDKYGIKVISALEPIAEDEGGEFYEMFLEWNAEKYSKRLSKRVRDGLDISVANGTYCGGYLIYGYKIDLEPIASKPGKYINRVTIEEEQAKIVRFAFEKYDKGMTKKDIATSLNNDGYRLKGKPFIGKSFDKWLINEKYTGEFAFGGRLCTNMYPPIIHKNLFQSVKSRLQKNKYFAGGTAIAREPYLLTGKLYCGHCGTDMVSDGGTSKQGIQHHYYTCKKRKKRQCEKKRENKNSLEFYVTAAVIDFLSVSENIERAVSDVLNYYDKKTDENNLKSIQTKIANIHKEVDDLADAFVKAKSELLQNSIEMKMNEYECLLSDLTYQQAVLELERGYKLTKKDMVDFISELLVGDKNDKEFQKIIIDNLVLKVFVSDDNTVVYFNIKNEKTIQDVCLKDTTSAAKRALGVQTQLPPSRQKQIIRTRKNRSSYFSFQGIILGLALN